MLNNRWWVRVLSLVGILAWGWSTPLKAATIEMEESDDIESTATPAAPTPTPSEKGKTTEPAPKVGKSTEPAPGAEMEKEAESLPAEAAKPVVRAKISDQIGFFYFVAAGYVTDDPSQIPSVGKVSASTDEDLNYTTPKKTY